MFQIYSPLSLPCSMLQRTDELVDLPSGFWLGLASWGNRRRTGEREWSWGLHSPDSLPAGCHRLAPYTCGRPYTAPAIGAPVGCGTYSVVCGPSHGVGDGPLLLLSYFYSSIPPCSSCPYPSKISL